MSTTEDEKSADIKEDIGYTNALLMIQTNAYFSMQRKDWGQAKYVYWYKTGYDDISKQVCNSAGAYSDYVPT